MARLGSGAHVAPDDSITIKYDNVPVVAGAGHRYIYSGTVIAPDSRLIDLFCQDDGRGGERWVTGWSVSGCTYLGPLVDGVVKPWKAAPSDGQLLCSYAKQNRSHLRMEAI